MIVDVVRVSVEIRPFDAITLTTIRHQYPTTTLGSGAARLELRDVYACEPKSVLVEFFVPALLDDAGDAGDVRVAQLVVVAHVLTEQGGVERQEITFPIVSPNVCWTLGAGNQT